VRSVADHDDLAVSSHHRHRGDLTLSEIRLMHQQAPYPVILADLIETFRFKPGWRFEMRTVDRDEQNSWRRNLTAAELIDAPAEHCVGLTLLIYPGTTNSYNPTICEYGDHMVNDYGVVHLMPVPAATYNLLSWQNWLLEQCLLVEKHEICEFACFDGQQIFGPIHAPGFDPYMTTTVGVSEIDRRTSFRGVVKDKVST
jgi:hypothetical protein